MGSEDDRLAKIKGCAEVRDTPDTGFEDVLPVLALMDLTANADFVDDEAVFFGEGWVKGG